jgi:hypothetical protein
MTLYPHHLLCASTNPEWSGRLLNGQKSEHGMQTAKATVKSRRCAAHAMERLLLRAPPFRKLSKQQFPSVKGRAKQQRREQTCKASSDSSLQS